MTSGMSPHRHRLRRGDVVAVTLPPGEAWPEIMATVWEAEAALLPVDHRLPAPARRSLLERGQATVGVDAQGWRRTGGGRPADPQVALVIATSGSTRLPRLVELTRDAVTAAVQASQERLGAGPADGWVSCLPLAHVGGLLVLLRCLLGGGPLRFRPPDDLASEPGFPFVSVVPRQLVRALDAGTDLRGYRAMVVGGSGMGPEVRERAEAAGAPVVQTYGQTESCGGVVYDGIPLPGVLVRISAAGEIELGGPTLLRGYRDGDRGPEAAPAGTSDERSGGGTATGSRRGGQLTAEGGRLTADGWLRTGDAGLIDSSGRLQVLGRLDALIVTGGEKVWPEEVERALRSHPAVADCSVFGRPDRDWGERVVAAVVARDPASPPSLEDLREQVGGVLGRHAAPRELVVVAALPRTALGKVDRGRLLRLGPPPAG
jgi:O-succinylbenzoic acid--CoA ligase